MHIAYQFETEKQVEHICKSAACTCAAALAPRPCKRATYAFSDESGTRPAIRRLGLGECKVLEVNSIHLPPLMAGKTRRATRFVQERRDVARRHRQSPFPGAPLYGLNLRAEWLRKRQGCILPGIVAGYRALLCLWVYSQGSRGLVEQRPELRRTIRREVTSPSAQVVRKPRCSLRGVGDSLYEEAVPEGTASLCALQLVRPRS